MSKFVSFEGKRDCFHKYKANLPTLQCLNISQLDPNSKGIGTSGAGEGSESLPNPPPINARRAHRTFRGRWVNRSN